MEWLFDYDSSVYGGDPFGIGAILSTVASMGIVWSITYVFVFIAISVVTYAFCGWVLLHMGRKAGVRGGDWMAFVPFCRSVYGLKIIGEPWWKMFWFENSGFFGGIVLFLGFLIIGMRSGFTVLLIIVIAYCVFGTIYGIIYHMKLYQIFGIDPLLALAGIIPIFNLIAFGVECLIAFSSNFQPSGDRARAVAGIPINQMRNDIVGGAARGSITGLTGMYKGASIDVAVGDELIIGRDPVLSNLIISENADKISRKHCGIVFDGAKYSVMDYSSNGTFKADGTRLMANIPTTMPRGTEIILGSKQLSFRLD
jgi:hypothetical protein